MSIRYYGRKFSDMPKIKFIHQGKAALFTWKMSKNSKNAKLAQTQVRFGFAN